MLTWQARSDLAADEAEPVERECRARGAHVDVDLGQCAVWVVAVGGQQPFVAVGDGGAEIAPGATGELCVVVGAGAPVKAGRVVAGSGREGWVGGEGDQEGRTTPHITLTSATNRESQPSKKEGSIGRLFSGQIPPSSYIDGRHCSYHPTTVHHSDLDHPKPP